MLSALIVTAAEADVLEKKKSVKTHTEGPSTAKSPKTRRLCSVGCINFSHVNIIFIKVILSQLDAASRGETLRKR